MRKAAIAKLESQHLLMEIADVAFHIVNTTGHSYDETKANGELLYACLKQIDDAQFLTNTAVHCVDLAIKALVMTKISNPMDIANILCSYSEGDNLDPNRYLQYLNKVTDQSALAEVALRCRIGDNVVMFKTVNGYKKLVEQTSPSPRVSAAKRLTDRKVIEYVLGERCAFDVSKVLEEKLEKNCLM